MTETKAETSPGINLVETPYVTLWMEDDILCGRYANNLHLNLAMATEIVNDRLRFVNYQDMYCFADIRGIRSATREARQHLAIAGSEHIIACALLVDSLLSKTLGNIFLTINKPLCPMRMFTNKDDAMQWIKNKKRSEKQGIR